MTQLLPATAWKRLSLFWPSRIVLRLTVSVSIGNYVEHLAVHFYAFHAARGSGKLPCSDVKFSSEQPHLFKSQRLIHSFTLTDTSRSHIMGRRVLVEPLLCLAR